MTSSRAPEQRRFELLMGPDNRWFVWDVDLNEPLTARGDIISSFDRDEMAFVMRLFEIFHNTAW